jgi:hypothetical protein
MYLRFRADKPPSLFENSGLLGPSENGTLIENRPQREGAHLKGAMWSLRGNAWNLTPERQVHRQDLCRQYTQLGRAMTPGDSPSHFRQLRPPGSRSGTAVVVSLGRPQPPLVLSPFGHDPSSALGWNPGLLRHQADLRSHRGRQRNHPTGKTNGSGF